MSWLERIGGRPREESAREEAEASETARLAPVQRSAPALAAVFEGLSPDGSHAVLDLGLATQDHLRLYGPYASWARFAGFLPEPPRGPALRSALRELPPNPARPYDVVLLWDLLDRLGPDQRTLLMDRVARITAPDARLYAIVHGSEGSAIQPLRFTPLGPDRISHEAVGEPEPAGRPLLPAEMERVLEPFRVLRAFTLRIGMREYVAVKDQPGES